MEGGRITRVKSCSICGIRTRNLSYSQLFVKEMKTKYLRLSARPQRNSCSCSPASVTFEIYLLKGCCGTGTNALCRPSFFSSFLGAIQMILKFVNTMQTVHEILLLIPFTFTFKCNCMKVRNFWVCTFTLHWNAAKSFLLLHEIEYLVALYYPQDQYNNIRNVRVSEKQKEMS